jgi:hypothetical protein
MTPLLMPHSKDHTLTDTAVVPVEDHLVMLVAPINPHKSLVGGAGLSRPLRVGLTLIKQRLFPRSLGAGSGRGASALRHAGRLRRAQARERRLWGQTG